MPLIHGLLLSTTQRDVYSKLTTNNLSPAKRDVNSVNSRLVMLSYRNALFCSNMQTIRSHLRRADGLPPLAARH